MITTSTVSDKYLVEADNWVEADNTLTQVTIEIASLVLYALFVMWVLRTLDKWINSDGKGPGPGAV